MRASPTLDLDTSSLNSAVLLSPTSPDVVLLASSQTGTRGWCWATRAEVFPARRRSVIERSCHFPAFRCERVQRAAADRAQPAAGCASHAQWPRSHTRVDTPDSQQPAWRQRAHPVLGLPSLAATGACHQPACRVCRRGSATHRRSRGADGAPVASRVSAARVRQGQCVTPRLCPPPSACCGFAARPRPCAAATPVHAAPRRGGRGHLRHATPPSLTPVPPPCGRARVLCPQCHYGDGRGHLPAKRVAD